MKKASLIKELRDKDNKALNKELLELEQKMAKLRLDAAMRKLKNVKQIEETRKRVARIWTILNERAMAEIVNPSAEGKVTK